MKGPTNAIPSKACRSCGRTITWRKAWARTKDEVRYCSDACRQRRLTPTDDKLAEAIVTTLGARTVGPSMCPSEAAKAVFAYADRAQFTPFHNEHSRRITWIVGPGMGVALLSAFVLVVSTPERVSRPLVVIALGVLLIVHAATVMLSIPSHNTLGRGWDQTAHQRLVATNWVRTIGWSVRSALAVAMVAQYAISHSR